MIDRLKSETSYLKDQQRDKEKEVYLLFSLIFHVSLFFLFFLFLIGNQCIQFAKTYDQVCSSDCLC